MSLKGLLAPSTRVSEEELQLKREELALQREVLQRQHEDMERKYRIQEEHKSNRMSEFV